MRTQRRIVLTGAIEGAPKASDFRLEEKPLPETGENQALVRVIYCSVDPGTRSRLSGVGSYAAGLKAGDVVDGFCVGEIIESRNPRYAEGDLVALGGGWADHVLFGGRGFIQKIPHRRLPLSVWIGILGIPGMTAWFGLKRVGQLKEGDRVLATSTAGPVGATAAQLAKLMGASHVVGVAGGPEKCAWVRDVVKADAVVDYKNEDLEAGLRAASKEGYDILFDNVGSAMMSTVLPMMLMGGRIVVSGQTADYNLPGGEGPGLQHTSLFITQRLRMEGLVVFDDMKGFADAQAQMSDWIEAGKLAYREERFAGLEKAPEAFTGLFTGASFGRRIIEVSSE